MNKIKYFLKQFTLIVKVKRQIWSFIFQKRPFWDEQYFPKLFKKHYKLNIHSLDFNNSLVKGNFLGVDFILLTKPRSFIETTIFTDQLWESHILSLISSYLYKPNSIMIDIGANSGATSIPLAKKFSDCSFYLFEPHPEIFSILETNCQFNRLKNVKLIKSAISDTDKKKVRFYAQKQSLNMGLSSLKKNYDINSYDHIDVQCTKIDNFFSKFKMPISVIKIDTQGNELEVLRSAFFTIKRHKPIIIFEFESEYFKLNEEEKIRRSLKDLFFTLNYELFYINSKFNYYPKVNLSNYFHGEILALPK